MLHDVHDSCTPSAAGPRPGEAARTCQQCTIPACIFISLCLLFASVGQASVKIIASLPWALFTSLLTHRLVLLCIDAHNFIFWGLPGDVLAAPESALGLDRCNTSSALLCAQFHATVFMAE